MLKACSFGLPSTQSIAKLGTLGLTPQSAIKTNAASAYGKNAASKMDSGFCVPESLKDYNSPHAILPATYHATKNFFEPGSFHKEGDHLIECWQLSNCYNSRCPCRRRKLAIVFKSLACHKL
eukprot:2495281-Amphidinium_carterae.1